MESVRNIERNYWMNTSKDTIEAVTVAGIYDLRRLQIKRSGRLDQRAVLALDCCPSILLFVQVTKFDGPVSLDLARRAILAYERMSRFEILTGHFGDGIRYLFFGAKYCIWEDDFNWIYRDTDLGSYSYFCGELRHEFIRLCEEGMRLAKKFRREDVLLEGKPKQMLEMYYEQTQEERDLEHCLVLR